MNLKQVGADIYVQLSKVVGLNTVTHHAAGEQFKFGFASRPEFIKAKNAIRDGYTSEGIEVSYFDLDPALDAVFDVGAHHGTYSVILGVLNPESQLYTYEPVDALQEVLIRNLELNGLWPDANVSDNPVSGISGDSLPYREDSTPGSERHGIVDELGPGVSKKSSVALSDVFDMEGIDSAWLKIDAEGEEGAIVDDLVAQESATSLAGIIELHPDKLGDDYHPDEILDTLRRGFDVEFLCESAPGYQHKRPIYSFESGQ